MLNYSVAELRFIKTVAPINGRSVSSTTVPLTKFWAYRLIDMTSAKRVMNPLWLIVLVIILCIIIRLFVLLFVIFIKPDD